MKNQNVLFIFSFFSFIFLFNHFVWSASKTSYKTKIDCRGKITDDTPDDAEIINSVSAEGKIHCTCPSGVPSLSCIKGVLAEEQAAKAKSTEPEASATPAPTKEQVKTASDTTTNKEENYNNINDLQKLCAARKKLGTELANSEDFLTAKSFIKNTSSLCELQEIINECSTKAENAVTSCAENKNSMISDAAALFLPLSDMAGTIGMTQVCSKLGGALNAMNVAVGAFRGICGTAKGSCETVCQEGMTIARKLKREDLSVSALSSNIKNEGHKTLMNQLSGLTQAMMEDFTDAKVEGTLAANNKVCQGKEVILQNAGQNAIKLSSSMMSASQCEKSLNPSNADFCKTYPQLCPSTNDTTPYLAECAKTENLSKQECVCYNNPLDTSCSNNYNGGGSNNPIAAADTTVPDFRIGGGLGSGGAGLMLPNVGKSEDGFLTGLPDGAGSGGFGGADGPGGDGVNNLGNVGGPGGGPSGGGRGSVSNLDTNVGGTGAGGSRAAGPIGSGFNSNILGSAGGGADGLGMFGRRTASEKEKDLKDFLPGGEKDPNKLAGKLSRDGVTVGNGLSLFQKISNSYKSNQSRLIQD